MFMAGNENPWIPNCKISSTKKLYEGCLKDKTRFSYWVKSCNILQFKLRLFLILSQNIRIKTDGIHDTNYGKIRSNSHRALSLLPRDLNKQIKTETLRGLCPEHSAISEVCAERSDLTILAVHPYTFSLLTSVLCCDGDCISLGFSVFNFSLTKWKTVAKGRRKQ